MFALPAGTKEHNFPAPESSRARAAAAAAAADLRLLCSAAPAPCAPAPPPSSPAPPAASAGRPGRQQPRPETGAGSRQSTSGTRSTLTASPGPARPPHLRAGLCGRLQHRRLVRGAGGRRAVSGQTLLRRSKEKMSRKREAGEREDQAETQTGRLLPGRGCTGPLLPRWSWSPG